MGACKMKKSLSKTEARKNIEDFFLEIKSKTPKQIKKVKRLAMAHNLPLKYRRRSFCKKCFGAYKSPKIRIKNKKKIITCEKCGYVGRWNLN